MLDIWSLIFPLVACISAEINRIWSYFLEVSSVFQLSQLSNIALKTLKLGEGSGKRGI
jgi:hypothetical protein